MTGNEMNSELKRTFEGLRVLVAEDDPMAAKLAQGALRLLGVKDMVVAKDGLEALKHLKDTDGEFQLVVSDWNMPRMNGLEFLQAVRKLYPHMRFVMLTAKATQEFVVAARDHGVDAYVVKPFSPNQLRQKVEALFRY